MSRCVCAVLVALAALPALAQKETVSVVVAAVDIAEGETITMELISQRQAPKSVATKSWVTPDSASFILNERIAKPVLAGDPLPWSFFEAAKVGAYDDACRKKMVQPASAPAQIARHRRVALKRR